MRIILTIIYTMINFPSSLDLLSNPSVWDYQDTVPHSSQHSNANDAIEALEAKVGINSSSDPASLDYKVAQLNVLTTKGDIIVRSATGNTRLPVGTDGQMLVADSTQALGVKYTNPSSGGTVTTASVVSANWFTGSVANPTTTPAITLATSVTGVLKGNGTAISAATAGTDYYAPGSTDVSVADGGTGVSTLTAYAPIFGGTTGTGAVQSGSVGSAGQILTSNGIGALPTFQNRAFVWVLAIQTSTWIITDNSLDLINFDNELYDTDGFHSTSTNNSRLTVPAGKAGKYDVRAQLETSKTDATLFYTLSIYKNGVITHIKNQKQGNTTSSPSFQDGCAQVSGFIDLAVWDYLELYVSQNNTGWGNSTTIAAGTWFGMTLMW
jgi:hypothetical protein